MLPCSLRTAWDCLQEILKLSNLSQRAFKEQPHSIIVTLQNVSLLLPLRHQGGRRPCTESREVELGMGRKACHRISAFSFNSAHIQVSSSGLSHSHADYSVPIKNLTPKSLKFFLSFSFLPPPPPATIGHLSKAKWAQNAILNVGRTHYLMCPENKQGLEWLVVEMTSSTHISLSLQPSAQQLHTLPDSTAC